MMLAWVHTIATATDRLGSMGFSPLDGYGGSKHGWWECTWTAPRRSGAGYAAVSLAFDELPGQPGAEQSIEVEIWCGAEADGRFIRLRFATLRVQPYELEHGKMSKVYEPLEHAGQAALEFADSDLTHTRSGVPMAQHERA